MADFHFGMAKAESDPFGSVGRGTPRPPRGNVTQQSPKKGASQAGRSYEDFRKALAENGRFSSSSNEKSASDSGDESNILFKGRRVGPQNRSRNANEIWQNMLKKGKSSGTAVPGTVSSTVAQGVLPNYAGHATASLTPAIANTAVSPKGSSRKPGESGDAGPASQDGEKVENRPSAGTKAKGSLRRAAI
ncbi:hypothetical protein CDD83_6654 [Cordyceps sp. RAO-2017]|nr:hypothetical protein CDD83_6654 [Cordyceps sp. RAO-2017]